MVAVVTELAPGPPEVAEALYEIALSVNSTLELSEVLDGLARRSRKLLNAARATVLVAGSDGRLHPAASSARRPDPVLWALFKDLPPLDTDLVPGLDSVFATGDVVVIEDVASSPILSAQLKLAFGLSSLAIAPLIVSGARCGAIVVESGPDEPPMADEGIHALQAIAALAATAVRNAQEYRTAVRRSTQMQEMLKVAASLNASTNLEDVLTCAMDGVLATLHGRSCSVNLLDDGWVTTLASRGAGQPRPGRHDPHCVNPVERQRIRDTWKDDQRQVLVYAATDAKSLLTDCPELSQSGYLVLIPFADGDSVRGFVMVGTDDLDVHEQEDFAVVVAIAGQAGVAIERARLNEAMARRLHHTELLSGLADELAVSPDIRLVLERLAPAVREAAGAELIDLVFCHQPAARLFKTSPPVGTVAALLRRWKRAARPVPVEDGGLVLVPMRLDDQLVGALRVRAVGRGGVAGIDLSVVLGVATGIAGLVCRSLLRSEVEANQRALAITDERERIARDLHDTLGQMLFCAGLDVGECAEEATDEHARQRLARVQGALSQANAEVRQAIHSLSFLDRAGHDLVRSLRGIVRDSAKAHGYAGDIRVTGVPRPLSPAKEEALFRVAHEAMVNIERHARASVVIVRLSYTSRQVRLTISDDGVGMPLRPGGDGGLHFGLRTMRRRMNEVGGTLTIESVRPHGVRLRAVVGED